MAVKMMGAQVKRKEDPRLITGTSTYTGDISLPGLHYVAFVRSPHAHARIRRIDGSAVLKRPGVVAVVTGADLKPHCGPVPVDQASTEGGAGESSIGRKHYPLAIDRVRHVGEAVAAVIATTEALAVDGAADVVVDWEPLARGERPAGGPEARRPADPRRRAEQRGAREPHRRRRRGRGLRQAPTRWSASGWSASGSAASRWRAAPRWPRPTRARAASWSGPRPRRPTGSGTALATILGLEQNQIRVIAPEVGGGFGVKFGVYPEDAALAAMAKVYRLPLRWVETRVEHMVATTHGRAHVTDVEAAVEQGRHDHRAPGPRPRRHRRLSDLHVHPGPGADDGRRRLPHSQRRPPVDLRLHQHDPGGRLPRRRPPGGLLLHRAHRRRRRPGARPRARGGAAQELHRAQRLPLHHPDRPALRQRRVRPRADQGAPGLEVRGAPERPGRPARAGTTGSSSASGSPATSRCAASGRSRAPSCAWSRRER